MSQEYLIVEDGIITNAIICADDRTAALFGAIPTYNGAEIGSVYNPPEPEPETTLEERVSALESAIEKGLSL